uniref:Uncharacterized protein n=1 Tax=Alexandrium catenella TaxID=2925 RepID=A0A7S1RRJ7_ALECA|mmetsp:Transcript_69221/g.184098  ORF Transcript_69221/g.184098 Transcript_69221/m.184098 type:complete len:242 (+) Transcript_69221:116-841(+)
MGVVASIIFSCCDEAASQVGLEAMKMGLVGKRMKAKTNPTTEPEVYVTIVEISKKGEGMIRFSPAKFTLRDLVIKTDVELIGSKSELAAKAAMKGADVAMGKMALDTDKKGKVLSSLEKATSAAVSAKDKMKGSLGIGPKPDDEPRKHHIKVEVTVDMTKEMGSEEVLVNIKDFHTDMFLLEKAMSSEKLRKHMENTMSEKATEVATNMARQKTKQATDAVHRVQEKATDAAAKIMPGSAK